MVAHARGQGLPNGEIHVFAVHLRDLLANQGRTVTIEQVLQGRNRRHKLLNTQLGSGVAQIVLRRLRRAGNRAAGAQQHNFFDFF